MTNEKGVSLLGAFPTTGPPKAKAVPIIVPVADPPIDPVRWTYRLAEAWEWLEPLLVSFLRKSSFGKLVGADHPEPIRPT